jgi:Zn-dependent protease
MVGFRCFDPKSVVALSATGQKVGAVVAFANLICGVKHSGYQLIY